jgi:hypothetical protein
VLSHEWHDRFVTKDVLEHGLGAQAGLLLELRPGAACGWLDDRGGHKSIDGYIKRPDDGSGKALGDGGERLPTGFWLAVALSDARQSRFTALIDYGVEA